MKKFFKTLSVRIKADTPKWFRSIIIISISISATAAAVEGAYIQSGKSIPPKLEGLLHNLIFAGLVAAAIAKTAKIDVQEQPKS